MRRLLALTVAAALTALLAGCGDTTTNTTTNTTANTTTANTANTNANANLNANANTNTANANARRTYNANISRAEYEREQERYRGEAKGAGETVGQSIEDGWLWVKAKGALAGVDDLRDSTINVDVDNGVITLRGTVANAQQKQAAVKAANGIEGKKSVKDQLKIAAAGGANANGNSNNANRNGNANRK